MQSQKAFCSRANDDNNFVACAASAHRKVQTQCLKMGMLCDSLTSLEGASELQQNNTTGGDGGSGTGGNISGTNFHHRKAADLCRRYVQKLKSIDEVASTSHKKRR